MRRRILSVGAAMLLLAQSTLVSGHHGGRDIGSILECGRPGIVPPRCTSVGNSSHHFVFFDATLTDELVVAMRATMAEDYDPTVLTMHEQAAATAYTDVVVYSEDYGENGAAGWVNCPTDAPRGINSRGHRWCQQQELHLNLNPRYAIFFDDEASRDYVACHEFGHTLGLRHWGNPPESEGPEAATCMNADTPNGPVDLHQFDIDHLNAYYATRRPTRWFRGAHVASGAPSAATALAGGGVHAAQIESYASLASMTRAADAVVRGEIVAIAAGRVFGDPAVNPLHYAAATIRVSEAIAGHLQRGDASTVTLEIPLFDGAGTLAALRSSLVGTQGVFFLRNKGESARHAGLSVERQQVEAAFYRLVRLEAAVLDEGGRAAVGSEEAGPLAALRGEAFVDAADMIRGAAD